MSAPATPTHGPDSPSPTVDELTPEEQIAHWKQSARHHENEEKAAKAALDRLRGGPKRPPTPEELDAAFEAGRQEAQRLAMTRVAGAEVQAALTGLVTDPEAAAALIDAAQLLGDDNEVDATKLAALRTAFAHPRAARLGPRPLGVLL